MAKNSVVVKLNIRDRYPESFRKRECANCGKDISDKHGRAVICSKPCYRVVRTACEKETRNELLKIKCISCNRDIPKSRGNKSKTCGYPQCKKEMDWRRNLFSVHHIKAENFYSLLENQEFKCAICKEYFIITINNDKSSLNVDHDHNCCSGRIGCGSCVRGILCNGCNGGMGLFKDNPDNLIAAANYLTRYKEAK